MLIQLLLRNWLTLHGVIVALGLVFYVTVSRAFPQRRDPSAAVGWVVALALLPYVTLPLYIMFGSRKLLLRDPPPPRAGLPANAEPVDEQVMWALRLARAMGLPDASGYESLSVHVDGADALRALHDVIGGATRTLDVCTFILAHDAVGDEIAEALKARARSGVQVRLMVDGIGALLGGRVDFASLRAAGVRVVKFVPPFRSILRGRANLRNHRKLVVADAARLWCGGRNLAIEYFEGAASPRSTASSDPVDADAEPAWHDLSFDVSGALATGARHQFDLDWAYAMRAPADGDTPASVAEVTGPPAPQPPVLPPPSEADGETGFTVGKLAEGDPRPAVVAHVESESLGSATSGAVRPGSASLGSAPSGSAASGSVAPGSASPVAPESAPPGSAPPGSPLPGLAQLVPSGPDQVDDTVQVMLVSGCFMARRRVLAVTPYFVPDATLLQALTLAARRGVAVDLILPARSNHRLADVARNRPLRALTSAGARVWLVPHMVHAKAIVIDDEMALAGSANLDARSLFLNYELMVAFYSADDVGRFASWIERERRVASPYVAAVPGLARDLAEGLVLWLAFQL